MSVEGTPIRDAGGALLGRIWHIPADWPPAEGRDRYPWVAYDSPFTGLPLNAAGVENSFAAATRQIRAAMRATTKKE